MISSPADIKQAPPGSHRTLNAALPTGQRAVRNKIERAQRIEN